MTIRNNRTVAILGQDFTAATMSGLKTYKKGFRANYGEFRNGGYYVVEGHGIGHTIPTRVFTKFIRRWEEIEKVKSDDTIITKVTHCKKDITADMLVWFKQCDTVAQLAENRQRRIELKHKIAYTRKLIKQMKSGEIEADLVNWLTELGSLK